MYLFEEIFVLKLYKTKFLSCNLKGCSVLRRTPSVVDVKAEIKPKTCVFVRKKFRFKTFQNDVNNLATWKIVLCYVEYHQWLTLKQKSNRKLMFLFEKNFVSKLFKTTLIILQLEKMCCITSNTIGGCS